MSTAQASAWRWFPIGLIGALGVVVAVNAGMIWTAVHTFPGTAGQDGFDLSNRYNHVLQAGAQQAALGWRIHAGTDPEGRVTLHLADRDGGAIEPVTVSVRAERPVGPPEATTLILQRAPDGGFVASDRLGRGQWVLSVTAIRAGATASATERLVVP